MKTVFNSATNGQHTETNRFYSVFRIQKNDTRLVVVALNHGVMA